MQQCLHLYKKPLEQLDDERWYSKVTNPETGTFCKISDLPIEYRKNREDKPYPIRQVFQIIRIKRLDGTEWLKSRRRLVALDRLGNEVEHSFTDPELFYKPQTNYEMKQKDPKNSTSPLERKCESAGINPIPEYTEYTLPFSAKNFDQLSKMRPGQSPSTVTLSIYEEGSSESPRKINNYDQFKSKNFDELWTEATMTKVKLDRTYGDNLQDNQYN